jgi:hypothetical protein
LALKKPAASIMAEATFVVTEETAKYSFVARQEMA